MRGTFAVIFVVLLVVITAHLRREETQQQSFEDYAPPAMAYHEAGGCGATSVDIESELDTEPSAVANADEPHDAR